MIQDLEYPFFFISCSIHGEEIDHLNLPEINTEIYQIINLEEDQEGCLDLRLVGDVAAQEMAQWNRSLEEPIMSYRSLIVSCEFRSDFMIKTTYSKKIKPNFVYNQLSKYGFIESAAKAGVWI